MKDFFGHQLITNQRWKFLFEASPILVDRKWIVAWIAITKRTLNCSSCPDTFESYILGSLTAFKRWNLTWSTEYKEAQKILTEATQYLKLTLKLFFLYFPCYAALIHPFSFFYILHWQTFSHTLNWFHNFCLFTLSLFLLSFFLFSLFLSLLLLSNLWHLLYLYFKFL